MNSGVGKLPFRFHPTRSGNNVEKLDGDARIPSEFGRQRERAASPEKTIFLPDIDLCPREIFRSNLSPPLSFSVSLSVNQDVVAAKVR